MWLLTNVGGQITLDHALHTTVATPNSRNRKTVPLDKRPPSRHRPLLGREHSQHNHIESRCLPIGTSLGHDDLIDK